MSRVLGGDIAQDTKRVCGVRTQGAGCESGSCVPYSKDPAMCPLTEWDTCIGVIPETKLCVVKTKVCIISAFCIDKTDTYP